MERKGMVDEAESNRATQQDRLVESLARETNTSIADVHELLKIERARLETGARVKTFVPVLASRRVKLALRSRDSTAQQ